MFTITITWLWVKWAGLPLFIMFCLCIIKGDMPDSPGSDVWNGLRWIFIPLFLLWCITMFIRALWV